MDAVPTTGDHTLAVRHDDRHDLLVVAVRGPLSSSGGAALHRAVHTHLLDRGRVVVDLSGTTVPWGPVAGVFPEALAAAGGWPLARLVLACADPFTTRVLQAARVHLTVPLAASLAEARVLLDAPPPRLVRDHELPYGSAAPGLARAAVASMCDDWGLDDGLYEAAATLATELVTNALEHAGTACILHLALDRARLQVAVRDGSPVTEGRPAIVIPGDRGYGLLIVQGLSRGWGVTPYADGKTVWAMLDTTRRPTS
jgi:anti-sigma regulatory factor (Ser/Thr protein kinase)